MDVIVNKVAESGIVTINLERFISQHENAGLDIKPALFMEMILREKDFRQWIKEHDWEQYRNKNVAIYCSAEAIIPTWAYMLVASRLSGIASYICFGTVKEMEISMIQRALSDINPEEYRDKRVVIKGCSDIPIPEFGYVEVTRLLLPVVQSLMFGEPCSTVPVYKKPK